MNPASGFARRPVLRFAVMCADVLEAWQVKAIQHLIAHQDAELVLFIKVLPPIKASPRRQGVLARTATGRLLKPKLLWRLFYRALSRSSRAMQIVKTTAAFPYVRAIVCDIQKHEASEYFSQSDVAAIKRDNLDFILRFACEAIHGEILNAARYGVWSFHHGDEQRYRGGPPGFWEIYSDDPVNGASLERVSERPDARIVLKKGYVKTIGHSYAQHIDRLYFGTAEWPAYVAAEIRNGVADYVDAGISQSDAPIYEAPSNLAVLRLFVAIARNQLHEVRSSLHRDEWNIGVVRVPPSYFLSSGPLPPTEWMPVQSKTWVADPMALVVNGTVHILCEHFNVALGRGSIARTTVDRAGWGKLDCAFALDVHASYPYLLKDGSAIYCVPETSAANEATLYRAAPFPTQWVKERVLLTGPFAVDNTIFQHDGRWWLFCTRSDAPNYLLYAYFADKYLGPWHPHLANPVKMDIRSSRPAGQPFVHDGKLFRPAQDCSKTYGGRIAINRIDALSPAEFREETCAVIEPDSSGPYPLGLHTLSPAAGICVIDGKRSVLKEGLLSVILSRYVSRGCRRRLLGVLSRGKAKLARIVFGRRDPL